MIQNLETLRQTFILIIIAVVLLIGGVIGVFFLIRAIKKKDKKAEGATEDGEDYRKTKRADTAELIDIDDIRDNMIIDGGYSRFTCVLGTTGNDFYNASATDQIRVQSGYENYIRSEEHDWTLYVLPQSVNLDHVLDGTKQRIAELEEKLYNGKERYKQLKTLYDRAKMLDLTFEQSNIDEMLSLQKKMKGWQTMLIEARTELRYGESFTGTDQAIEKKACYYAYSWYPTSTPFAERLKGEALVKKASEELAKKAHEKCQLLSPAGVVAHMLNTNELIELFYTQTHPVTGGLFRLNTMFTLQKSGDDIVNSKTFADKKKQWKKSIVDQLLFGKE